ncbi:MULTISPECIES: hemolysin family protein [Niastella]|uniref:HlyC/CorC family transporter n=1 Tax=Niastella soli TaxID=2821487 RepID=A0ABS3YQ07_9BACT|nr:hemolysin family protein [Niastella soli]MBO9199973.1 HlyC/CorC family transporter [Niastella soli]
MSLLTGIGIVIGIVFLLLAYFAGIEVAFTSANRLNIELKKKQGSNAGILLSNLFDNPSRFIGTNVVGFSFFLTSLVLLMSMFLTEMVNWYNLELATRSFWSFFRLLFEIVLQWFLIILFGECIPKAIFKAKSDSLLSFSARVGLLGFFDQIFYWIAAAFVRLSIFILNVIFDMRIDKRKEPFSRSDLDHFFQQTSEYNSDGADMNTELFENALSLPKIKVRECLVPRKEIEAIDLNTTVEEARKKFISTRLSKLIVYGGNIDQILGYIHQLDLFKQPDQIKEILLPIPAIPESMSATDLINKFTKERKSIAWVVDEFGGTAGIVTMEDLLEEIFGEIKDEYDVEEFEEKMISEDEYILSGRLELDYLKEKYKLEFPENDSETLSGFIIHQHETIPRFKERIIIGNYEFEVLNVSDTRIEMVRLKILR